MLGSKLITKNRKKITKKIARKLLKTSQVIAKIEVLFMLKLKCC